MFAVGDKVQARWKYNGKWYTAKVVSVGNAFMQVLGKHYYVRFNNLPNGVNTAEHWVNTAEIK